MARVSISKFYSIFVACFCAALFVAQPLSLSTNAVVGLSVAAASCSA